MELLFVQMFNVQKISVLCFAFTSVLLQFALYLLFSALFNFYFAFIFSLLCFYKILSLF